MKSNLFEFKSSVEYLKYRLRLEQSQRGIKRIVAEHLRLQPASFSQILSGKVALSMEQGDLLNTFWLHSEIESHFFLLLVGQDKAGTQSLKRYYQSEINKVHKSREQAIGHIGKKVEISNEAKGIYYSSWIYPAIHIACTIDTLRKPELMAEYLGLSHNLVVQVLNFLEKEKLLTKQGTEYLPTKNWIRLDHTSPHVISHHTIWRQKTIEGLIHTDPLDLHFSGVYSMNKDTAAKIKKRILEVMQEFMSEIQSAPEKDLFVFATDLYKIRSAR